MSSKNLSSNAYNELFPSRLREIMEERGETQADVAKALGTTRQAISGYVTGVTLPDIKKLVTIAEHFGIQPNYFLVESEGKKIDEDERIAMKTTGLSEQAIYMLATQQTPKVQGKLGLQWQGIPELRKLVDLLCSSQAGVNAVRHLYQYVSTIVFAPGQQTENVRGHDVISITTIENGDEKHRYLRADYMRAFQREELLVDLKRLQKEATGECQRGEWETLDDLFLDME